MFALEERIRQLQDGVVDIDDNMAIDRLASLENDVALAVAQVSQSDHEVRGSRCNTC